MRYIDKSKHRQQGLDLIQDFLNQMCKDPDGRYTQVRYDGRDPGSKPSLGANGYKSLLRRILIENQDCYCCYCLRNLKSGKKKEDSDDSITLEHIIPRGYSVNDNVEYYRSAPGLSDKEVAIRDEFESPDYSQSKYLHPHNVAYNNLVLSCAGTFPTVEDREEENPLTPLCCNEARKSKEAYPIYLHPDAADNVIYLKNGDIQAAPGKALFSKVDTLIKNTRLDCDSLKQVRRMWYLLRDVEQPRISGATTSEEKRRSLLAEYLFMDANDPDAYLLYEKFIKQPYWDTLMLYNLFHDIMRSI